jgi:hypothetical protein
MSPPDEPFIRTDFSLASDPGTDIFVRHLRRAGDQPNAVPLLLVHGGGPGGLASFDLPVPGYSLNDRPERGRSRFLAEVLAFLADDERS